MLAVASCPKIQFDDNSLIPFRRFPPPFTEQMVSSR
jgi:hypothetical protein